jgi:hypothetical protein
VGEDKYSPEIRYNESIKTVSRTCGYIYNKKSLKLCAEFSCEWYFEKQGIVLNK